MADDNLRIVARVEDQFTGPLAKLKGELKGLGDEAKKQGSNWRKDWSGVTEDMGKFKGVLGGIEPILSKIGIGGFGAALSFGGAALALKNFSGSTRDLDLMARQIGLTANQLRTLSELGGKVGVSAETMKQGVNSFAGTMFELRQRWGQAYGELRNMNLGKLAEDLVNAPNMEAAIERAMDGLKNVSDPQKRARVSILLFGTPDIGVVANSLIEPAQAAVKRLQAELGTMDQSTIEAAKRFENNLNRMHNRWERLKLETLGPLLEGADKVIDQVEKERKAAPSRLNQDQVRRQIDVLDESIARKQANGDEAGAAETKKKRDALVEEMKRLTDEIRRAREGGNGASVSPSSFNGPAGGGSLIQKAAWGGAGGGNPDGLDGMRRNYPAPDYGSGPLGKGGGGVPDIDTPTPRGNGQGTRGGARTADMMRYAMDQLRREGVPEANLRQAAAHLVGQATMESGLDPNKVHDQGTGYGIYGARLGRRDKMLSWLREHGYARNSAEGQMRYMTHEAMSGRYRQTRHILMGGGSGDTERDTNTITGEFESPKFINRRSGAVRGAFNTGPSKEPGGATADENGNFPNGAPRALKPKSMADDPSVPGQVVGGNRGTGDALMDRFYGKGATGGGPAMKMPGATVGGQGTLHIKFEGAPAGMTHRASLDGLFDGHSVTKVRPQMDLDRA